MKDQVVSSNTETTDNGVKNLDIGALLQKKANKKFETHQAQKPESSVIEKVEENLSQMMDSLEETSSSVLAELKSSKAIYLSIAGGVAVLGGAYLAYRFLSNKKMGLKSSSPVRKTPASSVQSVVRKAKTLRTKVAKKTKK